MATIAEITEGSYRVETRVHQVVPSLLGHVMIRDLTPYFIPDGSWIDRDNCRNKDHAAARLHFGFADDEVQSIFGVPELPQI